MSGDGSAGFMLQLLFGPGFLEQARDDLLGIQARQVGAHILLNSGAALRIQRFENGTVDFRSSGKIAAIKIRLVLASVLVAWVLACGGDKPPMVPDQEQTADDSAE